MGHSLSKTLVFLTLSLAPIGYARFRSGPEVSAHLGRVCSGPIGFDRVDQISSARLIISGQPWPVHWDPAWLPRGLACLCQLHEMNTPPMDPLSYPVASLSMPVGRSSDSIIPLQMNRPHNWPYFQETARVRGVLHPSVGDPPTGIISVLVVLVLFSVVIMLSVVMLAAQQV